MASYNKVVLMGNLTRDPEVRYTQGGTAVCTLSLAMNHVWYDQQKQKREDVTFVEVDCWGRTAEIAGEFLAKGRPVLIDGRLKQETWEDKQTGQKRSKIKVVCESLQLLGGRDSGRDSGSRDAARSDNSSLSPDEAIAAAEDSPF